jgi:hypothetical protein
MDETTVGDSLKGSLVEAGWLVLPEFGVFSYEGVKQVDLAAFKWKNDREVEAIAHECKCKGTARESFLSSLGQAIEYQLFFPEVFIVTQLGDFFQDQELVLKKLGLGYIMINDNGDGNVPVVPSARENSLFNEGMFTNQVRNRAILSLTFNELFPEAYKKGHFGGTKQGELWTHNKAKGKVQFRAWTGEGSDSYFGINIEAVRLIRNIVRNINIDRFLEILSSLTPEYVFDFSERATIRTKAGYRILDRQRGSIPVEGSNFGEVLACNLTREQINKEVVERSKKLGYYTHILIDKKIWDLDCLLTRERYLKEMKKAKESLDEVYNTLTNWSG